MNTKIGIIVGAIILILIGGFFITKNKQSASTKMTTTSESNPASGKEEQQSLSLKSLIEMGRAQQCEFSSSMNNMTNNNMKTEGTIYTADGKTRGDYSIRIDEKTMISHMIVDGKTSYTWVDDQKMGYKMALDAMKKSMATISPDPSKKDSSEGLNKSIDFNQQMDYNCTSWKVDQSKFTIPSGVTFTDMSKMMEQSADALKDMNTAKCAACEQMPADAKAQCKRMLQCK